jgi:hypothetical protein
MEHRCGTRQNVPALTTLYPRLAGPIRGWVRDVSISGMFVELEAHPAPLPPQSLVEVELVLSEADGGRRCRCLAMVARETEEGLGLMFDRITPPPIARLLATGGTSVLPPARPGLRAARKETGTAGESSRIAANR